MASSIAPAPDTAVAAGGLPRREQIAFVVFSTWIISGLFLDGWSHEVDKPETFFTPWHALLYSGFGAALVWSAWDGRRMQARGEVPTDTLDKLATFGVLLFGIGMVSDFAWHEIVGIEVNVEGLLSPTHLLLMTGGIILAATPIRLAWAARGDETSPLAPFSVVQSITAVVAVVAFFTQFASPFKGEVVVSDVFLSGMGRLAEQNAIEGVTSILVTNAVFLCAIAFAISRWRLPRGALTMIVAVPALAVSGLNGFNHVELVVAAILGGLAGDVAVARDRADLAPIVVPFVMWLSWVGIVATTMTFGWSPSIWGGAVFLSVMTGFGLRVLTGQRPVLDQAR